MNPTYNQLIDENHSLVEKNRALQAGNRALQAGNRALIEEIRLYQAKNIQLEMKIAILAERIANLESQQNQNSKNSSCPPSKDKKGNITKRERKERRNNHRGIGRQLLPESQVTSREKRKIERCPQCDRELEPTGEVQKWQQIEFPEIKPLVHQIELITCRCPHCNLEVRPKLSAAEQYMLGPRLEGLVNLLMGQYRNSHRMVRRIIATLLPGVEISQGEISKIKQRAAAIFSKPYKELLEIVIGSKAPTHVDATGWRHAGKNEYAIVVRVGNVAAYAFKEHQNGETIREVLGRQVHHVVSDRGLACGKLAIELHQYCIAHLMRNICGQAEHRQITTKDTELLGEMYDILQGLFKDKHRAEKGEISTSTWRLYGYRKWQVIEEILEELTVFGTTKKLRKFCKKVLKDQKHFFVYLKDLSYPMTNNAAEEALRNLVIARKLCFGSQSAYGKQWREALHSCIESLYRNKLPILDFFVKVIQAARSGLPIPSLFCHTP